MHIHNHLFLLFCFLGLVRGDRVVYSIETSWDGEPITDHDFATVALDVNDDGDLVVEASAPFFNSPIPPGELIVEQQCPQRPHGALYNYEARKILNV